MENNNEVIQKLEYLDKMLQKDGFSNPIREVQENIRNELAEFREIFYKNLEELETNFGQSNTAATEVIADNSEIDKKNYQIHHLKQSFKEYEKNAEKKIEDLSNENTKLKYRINILLNTINN